METTEKAVKTKRRKKFFRKPTRLEVVAFFLILIAIIAVLWPFCTKRIEGGYVGVYYSTFFGGTQTQKVYNEGMHFLLPWDAIIPYDTRVQSQSYHIDALAKGGLSVQVELTAVYYINRNEAGLLHTKIGPEYTTKLINPAVLSSVRSVVGKLTQTELYDADILQIQEDALRQINTIFAGQPLTISSVLIREIVFPNSVATAINDKFVAEQNVLEERYKVLQEVEKFKETYVNAEATRFQQALISEGLTEAYLRYAGIEATKELSESDNAKLVIIGDKDGLPLILNPDSLTETESSETYPDGITEEDYLAKEGEQKRPEKFADTFDQILSMLDSLSFISDDVSKQFADISMDVDTTIPQQGQIGVKEENTENTNE